jgi:hypothetical protein
LSSDAKLRAVANEAVVFDPNLIDRTKITAKSTQVFFSPLNYKLNTTARLRAVSNEATVFDPTLLQKQIEIVKETAPVRLVNKLLSAEKVRAATPVLSVNKLGSAVNVKEAVSRLAVNKLTSTEVLRNANTTINTDAFQRTRLLKANQIELYYVANDNGMVIRLKTGNSALGQTGISDISAVKKEPLQFWN